MRAATLLYLGIGLLLLSVAARTFLDDALMSLLDPSQEQMSWLFTTLGLVASLSLALGTAVVAAAIVLLGLQGTTGGGDGGRRWYVYLPRKRPLFLADAVVSDVEDFAEANALSTEEAMNRLVLSGLHAESTRQD